MKVLLLAIALTIASPGLALAQDELDPRVMVMPVEGAPPPGLKGLDGELIETMARGAARLTDTVARATAPIADTAVIVGCEPSEDPCLDAVAAALNVDQLLIARVSAADPGGQDATVEVTAVTREARPVRQTFTVRAASRAADLAAIEAQVPVMLEAGESRRDEQEPPPPDPEPEPKPEPLPPPAPAPEGRSSVGPLVVVGVGAASLIAGGVFWGLAASTQKEIDDAPTDTAADLERLAELEDDARLRANVGNILVIAGAVVAAGGVTWYLVTPKRGREVHAGPLVVPGGGGIAIGGAW